MKIQKKKIYIWYLKVLLGSTLALLYCIIKVRNRGVTISGRPVSSSPHHYL